MIREMSMSCKTTYKKIHYFFADTPSLRVRNPILTEFSLKTLRSHLAATFQMDQLQFLNKTETFQSILYMFS